MWGVSEQENKIAGHENLIKTVFNGALLLPCLTASYRRRFCKQKSVLSVQGHRQVEGKRFHKDTFDNATTGSRVWKSNLNVHSIIYANTTKLKTHLATETLCWGKLSSVESLTPSTTSALMNAMKRESMKI